MSNPGVVDNQMMSSTSSTPMSMNPAQSNLFNHQISAYKYLIRNQPIPEQHMMVIKRHQQQFYPPNAAIPKQPSNPSSMMDSRYKPSMNGTMGPRYYPPVHTNGTMNYPSGSMPIPPITENVTTIIKPHHNHRQQHPLE
jgi:hypothetical protein